jgi:hypothetical protein
MKYSKVSNGVVENDPTWKTDVMAVQGLGLVKLVNVYRFYNELHSYLVSASVDGVKVDMQCILETFGAGLGGRVELTRQYHLKKNKIIIIIIIITEKEKQQFEELNRELSVGEREQTLSLCLHCCNTTKSCFIFGNH